METKGRMRAKHTVLVVADDFRILFLAKAVLTGKGHRVLVANDAQTAVLLLMQNYGPIHSVAIRADMSGHQEVRDWSLKQGAKPRTFHCTVTDQSVVLEGLDAGADRERAALRAS